MPRNSQGVYTLPSGNPVVPGTLIESTWANPTMSDLGAEITGSLPRNGTAGMTGPLLLARDGILNREAVTYGQLQASISGTNSFMPAGAIQAFAFSTIPTGWLECNGAAVSRTTYAQLFATIGTTYGVGNGVTTFNLPDLRGEFIRGFDNGRSVDPGRVMGSNQVAANNPHTHTQPSHTHTVEPHNHTLTDPGHFHAWGNAWVDVASDPAEVVVGTAAGSIFNTTTKTTGISLAATPLTTDSSQPAVNTEGTEARPRNVAMVYCIKAYGALQTDGLGSMAFQNANAVAITGGDGQFTTLSCSTTPVNPDDVVRLADIGSAGLTGITSSDPSVLLVDLTTPNQPILRPQTNVPNGTVKLDAYGKVPNALLDPTGYNYQGTWNASGGTLPGGTQLDGSMYYIDIAGTLTLYHSNGIQSATVCAIGTRIVYVTDSPTLPVPGWYYEPPPVLSGATASQVSLVPFTTITATTVQAGMQEIVSDTATTVATINGTLATKSNISTTVEKTSSVGAAYLPAGDTVDRPAVPGDGMLRFNEELGVFEGYTTAGGWGQIGGGQMYGTSPTKAIFFNSQTIAENLTVASGQNGGTFGPVTVNNGVTVTVSNGSTWSIV